jgi:hypothetical protein
MVTLTVITCRVFRRDEDQSLVKPTVGEIRASDAPVIGEID